MQAGQSEGAAAAAGTPPPPPPSREQAVLVLGATGRVGRRVVQKVRGGLGDRWQGGAEGGEGGKGDTVRGEQHFMDAGCLHARPCTLSLRPPPPPCMQLVMSGRTVVAAVKSTDRATEVFGALGLQEGVQQVRV